jgi:hypothetical protein
MWIGIDDTDTLDSPGTNKLALHLTRVLADKLTVRLVVRHQLFFDPRVPYTSHNGCVSMLADVSASASAIDVADLIRPIIVEWSPVGSDPGLCIATQVSPEVVSFAKRCQREVVPQSKAHELAARTGVLLESLGGTGDGAIGALAAVGLLATSDDGRVLHQGYGVGEPFDVRGSLAVDEILSRGVNRVENLDTGVRVESGTVTLSKRLRPNLRQGELVLFVKPADNAAADGDWQAVKLV